MNIKRILATAIVILVLLLGAGKVAGQQAEPQSPQGTYSYAFTYQGQLKDASGPVNDTCDLRFILWNAAIGGSQMGSIVTLEGVEIEDGLFTARLDFGGMDVHNGSACWLEVAVRCPAGSGGYVTLDPRQELTGAPAALSLALPFVAEANIGGPLVSFHNSGDGEAAVLSSQQGFALFVESAGQDGMYVASAGQNGVRVVSAGNYGLAVDTAGGDGVFVNTAHGNGLKVNSADNNGLQVDATGGDGVYVSSAGGTGVHVGVASEDGLYVDRAGNPSAVTPSDYHNGVEVAGAQGYGVYVGRADNDGVHVDSANSSGVFVRSASWGIAADSVAYDGVWVRLAGNPSSYETSFSSNGVEVAGAQGHGLYVGRADLDGVHVNSTGSHGLDVDSAAADGVHVGTVSHYGYYVGETGLDGVYVAAATWHGLNVDSAGVNGLYVSAAGYAGVDVAGNTWAGNFHGDINVSGNCIGCALAVFGLNAGDQPLEPGQVVAIQGIQTSTLDDAPALWRVVPAGEGSAAVGVVRGKAELDQAPEGATLREGETGRRLVPRSGAAQPGEYLSIVIYGPMQVRVSAAAGAVEPGTRLAVGQAGAARALKSVVAEGVTLAESAPTIGIALAVPGEDGLVWVLVNPQ
jgi:hypothetical protein